MRVSDYLMGFTRNSTASLEQLQVNPPNLPMFKQGTVPFMGDYIDVAPAPAFVPTADGEWAYNTAANSADAGVPCGVDRQPRRAAAVRRNGDGNPWNDYTPATSRRPAPEPVDPPAIGAVCEPATPGSRNQNIYTARITGGLLVGSPGNAKPLVARRSAARLRGVRAEPTTP